MKEYMLHIRVYSAGTDGKAGQLLFPTLKFKVNKLPDFIQEQVDKLSDKLIDDGERERREERRKVCQEIIGYLNERTKSQYKWTRKKTQSLINARMNQGYKLADFLTVIDKKVNEWKDDSYWSRYLCPDTLFCEKNFEKYLNQREAKPKQQAGTISRKPTYDLDKIKADIMNNTEI